MVQKYPRESGSKTQVLKFYGICDRMVEARGLDIIFVHNKQAMEAKIMDIPIPGHARVKDKELEKIEKYYFLREEIGRLWKLNRRLAHCILGAVSDMFEKYVGKLNVTVKLEVIQKAALLKTAGLTERDLGSPM